MSTSSKVFHGTLRVVEDDIELRWDGGSPPARPGVYEIRAPQDIPRLRAGSPVLYIGRSGDLSARLSQLADWGHNATSRVVDALQRADLWGQTAVPDRVLTLTATVIEGDHADPELEEVRRLARFLNQHCELPPLNRSLSGYLPFLALQRILEGISTRLHDLRHFGPSRLKVRKAWDHEAQAINYVELAVAGVDRLSLAWTWPAAWQTSVRRPDWWPDTDGMPYGSEQLFLFVHDAWDAYGHGPVRASARWRRARAEEPWLGLDQPIPLPWNLLVRAPDALTDLLMKGRLAREIRPLKPDAGMSDALRSIWADLGDLLTSAPKALAAGEHEPDCR